MLERYGALATFGRQPTPREMRKLTLADRITTAYWHRDRADNEAQWASDNPGEWELLTWALKVVNG